MKHILYILILFIMLSCKNDTKQMEEQPKAKTSLPEVRFQYSNSAKLFKGEIHRVENYPSNYITPRTVDVWLPESYVEENDYAVLYMHDGQMLFDSTSTWNKQEWKVDEWATQLMEDDITRDFIVVAVHNISNIRWQDLFPQKAFENLEETVQKKLLEKAVNANVDTKLNGDNYLKFIVEELKPTIDKTYSTAANLENTFVMGSSMGGLMSMYAISEYPNIFGGAACLSTHWPGAGVEVNNPLPEAIFTYMEANLPKARTHKLYFDYGNKTLDQHYPQYAPRVNEILKAKGYTDKDSKNIFFEGTDHSETSWNKRLDQPLTFLLGK